MTENTGIVVMEKPDYITYKDISDVLQKAHEQHRNHGIYMRVPHLPPEELEKWIGDEGKCFVAMDGDKLVGTGSYMIRDLSRWYHNGKALELTMDGILPEYQGMKIFKEISDIREESIRNSGYRVIYIDTAVENTRRLQIADKEGYLLVDYFWTGNHYSYGMMKWLDGCPFPPWYCKLRFQVKRCAVHIKHDLGLYKK